MTTLYMVPISITPQWLNNLGIMAANGTVQTYLAGTSTPQTTWTDSTGQVVNANPMTLSSTGRAVTPSGAPIAFWVPSGISVDVYVYDSGGNLLQQLKNLSALNDPAGTNSLAIQLASPLSANAAGVGPVAGVDLVANAVKSYDIVADVRAANAPTLAAGQTLNIQVQGGLVVNDGLGGDFYWSATSTATDNGTNVIKPNSLLVGNAGRWLRLGTPPFGALGSIVSAATTDLGTLGTNFINVTGNATVTSFGSSASTSRALYILTFLAGITLTYNATSLIIPGGASISTSANDMAIAEYLGSGNWQILFYNRSTGTGALIPVVLAASASITASTSLQPVLTSPTIPIGLYLMEVTLAWSCANSAAGYKFALNFGGTATAGILAGVYTQANSAIVGAVALGSTFSATTVGSAPSDTVTFACVLNVTVAGTFNLQIAQNTSEPQPLFLGGGSGFLLTPL